MGYIRIFYGLLLLYDRLLLGLDWDLFFTSGLIPCQQSFHDLAPVADDHRNHHIDPTIPSSLVCTLAETFQLSSYESSFYYLVWTFYYLGLIHMVLFTLGVAPKFHLLFVHIHLLSFHFYTPLLWDGEDTMVKIWNFLFLFLPLHHVTIYDFWRTKTSRSEEEASWPMWPFRLFQLEVCCVYAGAGYGKLCTNLWRSGNAMYHIIHEKDTFGGPFVPEFLFHRYGPLKIITWASLFLECTGIFLVWFRSFRIPVVVAMILLHVGIDLAMNLHIFEWISIIGWLMFPFESNDKEMSPPIKPSTITVMWYRRRWVISAFLVLVLTVFVISTFPLMELYDLFDPLISIFASHKTQAAGASSSPSISILKQAVNMLYHVDQWRTDYFVDPIAIPLLRPLGLCQFVWTLYSAPSDIACRYQILLFTYDSTSDDTLDLRNPDDDDGLVIFRTPDWDTLTWYEKKRWYRLMTMYEKLPEAMCRECFLQYHARQYLQQHEPGNPDINIASLQLHIDCEQPPPPPAVDDWFNWTGWFYANAMQDVFAPRALLTMYLLNFCDDRSVDCFQWQQDGLCDAANHQNRFTMTQLCRRSCRLCPEHGYDADHLKNGTRISIIWPVPSKLKMLHANAFDDTEDAPFYYDATIVSVQDRPWKRYLLKYDDSSSDNEWFDPILLRERGYRLLERDLIASPNKMHAWAEDASKSSLQTEFPEDDEL